MLVDRALQFSGRSDVSYFLLRFFFNIKKNQLCSPKNFPVWHLGYSVNQHAFLGHRIKRGGFPRTHILAGQTENRCRKIQNHKGGTEGEESCEVASRWLYGGRWNYSGKCPRKDELRACLNIWGGWLRKRPGEKRPETEHLGHHGMMEGSLEGRRECVGDDTGRNVGYCIWDVVNSGSLA